MKYVLLFGETKERAKQWETMPEAQRTAAYAPINQWFEKYAGKITGGKMYDEDFPAFTAYSNTLQSDNSGSIGYGTIVLTVNAVLLGGYTFSCHSLRHLVGGGCDQLSKMPIRQKTYNCVSCLNRRHMLWAWASLFTVGFADLYVRLCSMGVWSDLRIW